MLGIDGLFLAKLSETVINESKDGYPELEEKKEFIFKVLTQEEEKFNKTIDQGLAILSDLMEEMKKNGKKGTFRCRYIQTLRYLRIPGRSDRRNP